MARSATPRQRQFHAAIIAQEHNLSVNLLPGLLQEVLVMPPGLPLTELPPSFWTKPRLRLDNLSVNLLLGLLQEVPTELPDGQVLISFPPALQHFYRRLRLDWLSQNLQGELLSAPGATETQPDGTSSWPDRLQPRRPPSPQDYRSENLLSTLFTETQVTLPAGQHVLGLPHWLRYPPPKPQHYLSVNLQSSLYTATPVPPGLQLFPAAPAKELIRELTPPPQFLLSNPAAVSSPLAHESQGFELGPTLAYIYQPDWTAVSGAAGGLRVLNWSTERSMNAVGTFSCELAVDDQTISGAPLHTQVRRGWHVSFLQEGVVPLDKALAPGEDGGWLVYLGVVLTREYKIGAAGATLVLSGLLRSEHLVDRELWGDNAYARYDDGFNQIVDGDNYIGPNGGVIYPSAYAGLGVSATYTDISRFAALLKLAAMGRLAFRESWDHDRPQLIQLDHAPYSGYVFTNSEAFDPAMADAGAEGFGYISGTPVVRWQGQDVVNRIVPVGSDTVSDGAGGTTSADLTLQHAALSDPYVVKTATNPDGTTRYYIEDTDSQASYGVIEAKLIRTDIKNPNDDTNSRLQAANVLYAVAVGELLQKKSEILEVELTIANGSDVWALPGDTVVLQFAGNVIDADSNTVSYLDISKLFIITGRKDKSDPSGVRQVEFQISAPDVEVPVPGILPEPIPALPGQTNDNSFPGSPPSSNLPPPDATPYVDPCCADPTTSASDGAVTPPSSSNTDTISFPAGSTPGGTGAVATSTYVDYISGGRPGSEFGGLRNHTGDPPSTASWGSDATARIILLFTYKCTGQISANGGDFDGTNAIDHGNGIYSLFQPAGTNGGGGWTETITGGTTSDPGWFSDYVVVPVNGTGPMTIYVYSGDGTPFSSSVGAKDADGVIHWSLPAPPADAIYDSIDVQVLG